MWSSANALPLGSGSGLGLRALPPGSGSGPTSGLGPVRRRHTQQRDFPGDARAAARFVGALGSPSHRPHPHPPQGNLGVRARYQWV